MPAVALHLIHVMAPTCWDCVSCVRVFAPTKACQCDSMWISFDFKVEAERVQSVLIHYSRVYKSFHSPKHFSLMLMHSLPLVLPWAGRVYKLPGCVCIASSIVQGTEVDRMKYDSSMMMMCIMTLLYMNWCIHLLVLFRPRPLDQSWGNSILASFSMKPQKHNISE